MKRFNIKVDELDVVPTPDMAEELGLIRVLGVREVAETRAHADRGFGSRLRALAHAAIAYIVFWLL